MNPRMLSLHHMIKTLILFGFAMYIVQLVRTENILLYIAPRMVDYVKWSAMGLYMISMYQMYLSIQTFFGNKAKAACNCNHDHTPSRSVMKNTFVYGIFIFTLLLAFLMPDTTMGTSMALKKGLNLDNATVVKRNVTEASPQGSGSDTSSEAELFTADRYTQDYANYAKELYKMDMIQFNDELFVESLTTVSMYLDRFIGKKLELSGLVFRSEEMKNNQFVVMRFAMQCCAADAAPIGVLVQFDQAPMHANDTWVTVTGVIEKTKINNKDIMVLNVEKATTTEPNNNQYVYSNLKFGK